MVQKEKKIKAFASNAMDFPLIITVLLLLAFGIIMVLSASAPTSLAESGNSYAYAIKQGISAIIGIVAMIFLSKFDYRIYKKWLWVIYVFCVILLLAVSFIGIGANGAKRWMLIAGFNFQPSEFTKIGFIIFYASLLTKLKEENKLGTFKWGFCYPILLALPPIAILLILQNHFSVTLLLVCVTAVQMIMAGTKIKHCLMAGLPAGLGGIALILKKGGEFRSDRIATWLNPWNDLTGDGWQIVQSLYAIGSGGIFGVGLGESKQKYLYIPEPHNDFIFAVLAEELGFIGCLAVILLFIILIWRGIIIAMKAPDMFGSLIAIGITSLIGFQVIINIAVVTNSMPVTGMPLPFFSYGGSALLSILASIGILLNISRAGNKV